MPYIASNGELYEDEEIFKIDYDDIEEDNEEFSRDKLFETYKKNELLYNEEEDYEEHV